MKTRELKRLRYRIRAVQVLSGILGIMLLINATGVLTPKVDAMTMKVAANPGGTKVVYEKNFDRVEFIEALDAKMKMMRDKASENELRETKALERLAEEQKAKEEAAKKEAEEQKKAEEKKEAEKIIETYDDSVWAEATLNYREGPGQDYKKIGSVSSGTKLNRTGVTNNGWVQIDIDGKTYYVSGDYVSEEEPTVTEVTYTASMASGTKGDYQAYAYSLFGQYGWGDSELEPLILLWDKESGWDPNAVNPYSSAGGIPQALPMSKMSVYGDVWDPYVQIQWGISYVNSRYSTPSNAWAFWVNNGWY